MPSAIQATWHEEVTYSWLSGRLGPARYGIHEGGTRSGKTYNICIALVEHLLEAPRLLSVVRRSGPALRATVRRDMIEVARRMGVYDVARHNRTEDVLVLPSGSKVEFFSTDDSQKVHGRKRNILWLNEANEIPRETFTQLVIRTSGQVILDYNPSMPPSHWIWRRFEEAVARGDAIRWRSTYRDNPFLSAEQTREIEALRRHDPWAWQVYGMGRRATPPGAIFRGVAPLEATADRTAEHELEPEAYGLDWGYNDPTVLVGVRRRDRDGARAALYVHALLHESYLTTQDVIDRLPGLGLSPQISMAAPIYADGSEPDRIEQMRRAGYHVLPAARGQGSVRARIDYLTSHQMYVTGPAAAPALEELRAYRWRTGPGGEPLDEPAHTHSHTPDAVGYAAYTHYGAAHPAPARLLA